MIRDDTKGFQCSLPTDGHNDSILTLGKCANAVAVKVRSGIHRCSKGDISFCAPTFQAYMQSLVLMVHRRYTCLKMFRNSKEYFEHLGSTLIYGIVNKSLVAPARKIKQQQHSGKVPAWRAVGDHRWCCKSDDDYSIGYI